ncbi:MAG: DUF5060 domain-containing protein [Kiritimatiellae bacterium]|nr:DUF5060 domain-containing protein [Kiritimatiellia bacterium]
MDKPHKNNHTPALIAVLLGSALAATSATAADFGITIDQLGSNICVEYEARTDAYYRILSAPSLTSATWHVREFQFGAQSTQSWQDTGILSARILGVETQAQYYRVARIWRTNSLDYDADGLGDVYEMEQERLDPRDPDSDRDGAPDGDEVNVAGTSASSPYSAPIFYYTFDTNMQGWSGANWGNAGDSSAGWTNSGNPSAGGLAVAARGDTNQTWAKYYIEDYDLIEHVDITRKPVYHVYVYVPADAPDAGRPDGERLKVKLRIASGADGWADHFSDIFFPAPGQWSLLSWDMSAVTTQALADACVWGIEFGWDPQAWNATGEVVLVDTVFNTPVLPGTNPPAITGVAAATNLVGKYEKFELTVGLTNVAGLNPYDAYEVDLEATFVSPSLKTWTIWGFFQENEDSAFGEGEWKVRFAADETGTWSYYVKVTTPHGSDLSATSTFSCVAGDRHGWIKVSDDDPHYFEQDDDTPFVGLGYCRAWYADDEGLFQSCAEHGINMLHWWLAPWDTMLTVEPARPEETWRESSTFYSYEATRAARLDRIVEYAERHGVKLVFTIWPHDAIRDFNYHKWRLNGSWARALDAKYSEPENYINAFSNLDDPAHNQSFFHDDLYKRFQEQLYRYLIARWGYSEAIGVWALVSEMFGTFANSLNCIEYQDPLWVTNKNSLFGENPYYHMDQDQGDGKDYTVPWLSFINGYFKTNDPFGHPTTASYATDEYWEDGFPIVDVTQIHTYSDLYNWITPPVTLNKYHRYLRQHYAKPAFMGEIGTVDWKHYEPDYLRVTAWPGLFTGGAITPMMWTTPAFSEYGDPQMGPWLDSMSDEMKVLAQFVDGIEFHRLGLEPADAETKVAGEPAATLFESFESGLNGWSLHGAGIAQIGVSDEFATDGSYSLVMDVDIGADEAPETGVEVKDFTADWSNYWPRGTLKMDLHVPEFYHPDERPDGFLLGINKDPRSILEIWTFDGANYKNYSTTNEYAADGGWKKLTVGMTWNLELPLNLIPTAYEAAHVTGIKLYFGDVGILRGPVWIDNVTVGLYPFNTCGMVSSNGEFAIAWIQDRRWSNVVSSAAQFQLNGLAAGTYNLEWWNTLSGPFASFNADAPAGTLSVAVPDFTKDIAVKIRRVDSVGGTARDVAVAAVQEPDWVLRSTTQKVHVVVMNQGTTSETFDVTLTDSTDATVIGTNSVTIAAGSNVTASFTWNNTNATPGVFHTLVAQAAAVPTETDTADNQFSGRVKVLVSEPPWDSCDGLRRWAPDATDSDGRTLTVSTNYATEETHSFEFYHRSPNKMQAYFGFDNVYEDWSNRSAVVYDVYVADSSTNAEVMLRSGADWDWYYSRGLPVSSGWNTNLTWYFQSNEWTRAVWNHATTNWDYYPNQAAGGLEEVQQIFIKFTGYTNDGVVYVDNIRLRE